MVSSFCGTSVNFSYESRADEGVSYRSGFRVESRYRLSQIDVTVDGSLASHQWTFAYTAGINETRSLLSSITESAINESGVTVTLPAVTFTYTTNEVEWVEVVNVPSGYTDAFETEFISLGGGTLGNIMADVNGDGYLDIYASNPQDEYLGSGLPTCDQGGVACYTKEDPTVFIQNGSESWDGSEEFYDVWQEASDWDTDMTLSENKITLLDLNGDLLPDFYRPTEAYCSRSSTNEGYRINSGEGWADTATEMDDSGTAATSSRFVDVNGDGWVDVVSGSYPGYDYTAPLPTGSAGASFNNGMFGWTGNGGYTSLLVPTVLLSVYSSSAVMDSGMRFVEVNGDGLMDALLAVHYDDTDPDSSIDSTIQTLYLNNGKDGWDEESSASIPSTMGLAYYTSVEWYFSGYNDSCLFDINGDGLMDWRTQEGTVGINNGSDGWDSSTAFKDLLHCGTDTGASSSYYSHRLEDLNGDGVMDEIETSEEQPDEVRLSQNFTTPDLLETIQTAQGGSLTLSYTLSTRYKNADDTLSNPDLPLIVPTVSEVEWDDGLGDTTTATYTYSGGRYYRYDSFRGEFAGFSEVTETIGDRVTTYTFDQGCETGDVCSSPFYNTGTIMAGTDGYYVIDNGVKRALTAAGWKEYLWDYLGIDPSRSYGAYKVQYTSTIDSVLAAIPSGINWDSGSDFQYQVDLSNYALKGRLLEREIADFDGNIYLKEINTWLVDDLGDQRYFPYLSSKVEYTFDRESTHRDRAWEYTYDNTLGRVTVAEELGMVTANSDTGAITDEQVGDERSHTYDYTMDTSTGLVTLDQETLYDEDSVQVAATQYTYDSNGNLTDQSVWLDTTGGWLNTTFVVNGYGLMTQQTNPRGYATTFEYDSDYLYPTKITNALSQVATFDYDLLTGQVTQKIDSNGFTYIYTYDGFGRALTQSVPEPSSGSSTLITTTSYQDSASPIYALSQTSVDGVTMTQRTYFDGFGREIERWSSMENTSTYAVTDTWYNEAGNIEQQTLPYEAVLSSWVGSDSGQASHVYEYDTVGRVIRDTTLVGMTATDYDQWENTVTDPNNNVKVYYYDAFQRLVLVAEVDGDAGATYTTAYTYNALDLLTQSTDTQNNIRTFEYDSLGRKTAQTDPHRSGSSYGSWSYAYDDNGNLLTQLDPKSQTIAWSYDALDRVLIEDWGNDGVGDITYTYDTALYGIGYPALIARGSFSTSYTYDALGDVATETRMIDGTSYMTTFTYDALKRLKSTIYPDGALTASYTYNADGALETVTENTYGAVVSDMDYSLIGQVSEVTYGNGTTTINTYDPDQNYRLTQKITTGIYSDNPDPDDDDDGVLDESDVCAGTVLKDGSDTVDVTGCALSQLDTDGDYLSNYDEIVTYGTDPAAIDSTTYHSSSGSFGVTYGTGSNVALGKTVTSLITESPDYCIALGYEADNLTDGNRGSLAYPGSVVFDYEIDLGTGEKIESVWLDWNYFGENIIAPYINGWRLTGTLADGNEVVLATGGAPDVTQTLVVLDSKLQAFSFTQLEIYAIGDNWIGIFELGAYGPDFDSDGDGVSDSADLCLSEDATGYDLNSDGCIDDTDGDGVKDNIDACLSVAAVSGYDIDGDGCTDDTDWDGHTDDVDVFPSDTSEWKDGDGDGYGDNRDAFPTDASEWNDEDEDGIGDNTDLCTATSIGESVDSTGCAASQLDGDGDGVMNDADVCPSEDATGYDMDENGCIDDTDADGVKDNVDLCALTVSRDALDTVDADGCALSQLDTDGDTLTDYDETFTYGTNPTLVDTDGDGIRDNAEIFRWKTNPLLSDTDADGISDPLEIFRYSTNPLRKDTDRDGLSDYDEIFTHHTNPKKADTDGDGVNDRLEIREGRDPLDPLARHEASPKDERSVNPNAVRVSSISFSQSCSVSMDEGLAIMNSATIVTLRLSKGDFTKRLFSSLKEWLSENFFIPTAHASSTSGNIQSLSYAYDAIGNLTAVTDSSITPTAKIMTYDYDSLNRLTSASSSGFGGGDYAQTYAYDSIGNMGYKSDVGTLLYTGTGLPGPHAVTSVAGVSYTYDLNGNLTSDGVNTYTWTLKNELETVTTPTGVWSYTYDSFGTRLTSTDPDGAITTYVSSLFELRPDEAVYYLYAGSLRVASISVPYNLDGSLGDPVTLGTISYYHQDHLGGTALSTDSTGTISHVYDYYPYGSPLLDEALSAPTPAYSFTGKEYTEDTGLYYFEARWYDPLIGRFVSGDPIQRQDISKILPDPQSLNTYAYARNNPLFYVDPTGLLQVHDEGATEEQTEQFYDSLDQLTEDVTNNQDIQDYYMDLYGVDILGILTDPEQGPDVYLGGESEGESKNDIVYGEYEDFWNDIFIYNDAFKSDNCLQHTIIHEVAHWANDISSWFGYSNPNLSGFPQVRDYYFHGEGTYQDYERAFEDLMVGYAAEIILYGTVHK